MRSIVLLPHRDRRRVARIDQEERLDLRVGQLVDLAVGILPGVHAVLVHLAGVHRHELEPVLVELRHLDIGREDRRADGDGVAALDQAVDLQAVEDVAHRRRAAFHREQVEAALGRAVVAHLLHQIGVHHLLGVMQHAVGHRIVVADDAVGELVHEGVAVEAELGDAVVDRLLQQLAAVVLAVAVKPGVEALADAVLGRHAAEILVFPHALRLGERELAEQEERRARRGGDPVRIAAAGVHHLVRARHLRALAGDLDQLVLELERAQAFELALLRAAHVARPGRLLLRAFYRRVLGFLLRLRRALQRGGLGHDVRSCRMRYRNALPA